MFPEESGYDKVPHSGQNIGCWAVVTTYRRFACQFSPFLDFNRVNVPHPFCGAVCSTVRGVDSIRLEIGFGHR